MRSLDRSRPYGEIWGGAGMAGYEQDGLQFDVTGRLRPGQGEPDEPPPPVIKRRPGRPRGPVKPQVEVAPEPDPDADETAAPRDYEALSDEELRDLVELQGETWEGRDAAIELLEDA